MATRMRGYSLGDQAAPVVVEEWADYQCPYCRRFDASVVRPLRENYVANGQVRYVFHDMAFLGPESVWAAEAAACADDQGQFWAYHDKLFAEQGEENSGAFSAENLERFAAEIGLDAARFDRELAAHDHLAFVEHERQAGEARGVTSTPTVFINGQKLDGVPDFDQLRQLIEGIARAA